MLSALLLRFILSDLIKPPDALSTPIFSNQEQIMAQKATIYKVELSVSDMGRYYYEIHKLTVAKHLSANMSNQTISLRGASVQQDS